MFKCPFVSVKALEDAFYRLLSFTDSCQYWCKEWRTLAQTMSCCLTSPVLNINHHPRHWVRGWAGKYCWHWHRPLLAAGPVLGSVITPITHLCCLLQILPPKLYCRLWEIKALSLYLQWGWGYRYFVLTWSGLVLVFWANAQGNLWNKLTRNIPTQQ